jgi:hypothetical protein
VKPERDLRTIKGVDQEKTLSGGEISVLENLKDEVP